jgi:hypothetical protein
MPITLEILAEEALDPSPDQRRGMITFHVSRFTPTVSRSKNRPSNQD